MPCRCTNIVHVVAQMHRQLLMSCICTDILYLVVLMHRHPFSCCADALALLNTVAQMHKQYTFFMQMHETL